MTARAVLGAHRKGAISKTATQQPGVRRASRHGGCVSVGMQWVFEQERGEKNRWRWKCVADGTRETLKVSPLPFKTREDCMRDAEKHGYVATERSPRPD